MTTQTKAILFTLATGAMCVANLGLFAGALMFFAGREWCKLYQGR